MTKILEKRVVKLKCPNCKKEVNFEHYLTLSLFTFTKFSHLSKINY